MPRRRASRTFFNVREPDLLQTAGAAAAVLEVDLVERLGRDLLELLLGGAGLLGVEEAGGVDGRLGDGQVPDAVLVRRPDRRPDSCHRGVIQRFARL